MSTLRKDLKHKIEYLALRSVLGLLNLLPVRLILGLCTCLGLVAWVVFPFRLRVAYKNLSTVFPEMNHGQKLRVLRRVYVEFTKTFGLIVALPRESMAAKIRNAQVSGREKVEAALAQGKGVIMTTLHNTFFEGYFAWFAGSGLATTLIYQKQANPLSDEFFVARRNHYGPFLQHVCSYEKIRVYEDALAANRLLIVSLDQNYTDNGVDVEFFGKPFSCARGTGLFHLRTGAPVMTSVYYFKDGEFHLDFDLVALPAYQQCSDQEIADINRRAIVAYESYIQRYPEQWFSLFHRLWSKKDYPPVRRSLRQIFF